MYIIVLINFYYWNIILTHLYSYSYLIDLKNEPWIILVNTVDGTAISALCVQV